MLHLENRCRNSPGQYDRHVAAMLPNGDLVGQHTGLRLGGSNMLHLPLLAPVRNLMETVPHDAPMSPQDLMFKKKINGALQWLCTMVDEAASWSF